MDFSLLLINPKRVPVRYLRWKSIDATLVERDVGVVTVSLFPEYRDDIFARGSQLAIFTYDDATTLDAGRLLGNTTWLLRKRGRTTTEEGQNSIVLTLVHPNVLLKHRVVAYPAGSAESRKSDITSDVLQQYVEENFISATDTTRNWSSADFVLDPISTGSWGPTLDLEGSYKSVFEILTDAVKSAAAQDVYCGFEVYTPQIGGPFHVRFYRNYRGTDRGTLSGNPRELNSHTAHFKNVEVEEDWDGVISRAYAGGGGLLSEQQVVFEEDANLISSTTFGLYEAFDSFNTDSANTLSTNAFKMLRDARPRRSFRATVSNQPEQYDGLVFGVNYNWGDILVASYHAPVVGDGGVPYDWETYRFDVRVNPVHVRVSRLYDEHLNVQGTLDETEITLQSVDNTENVL